MTTTFNIKPGTYPNTQYERIEATPTVFISTNENDDQLKIDLEQEFALLKDCKTPITPPITSLFPIIIVDDQEVTRNMTYGDFPSNNMIEFNNDGSVRTLNTNLTGFSNGYFKLLKEEVGIGENDVEYFTLYQNIDRLDPQFDDMEVGTLAVDAEDGNAGVFIEVNDSDYGTKDYPPLFWWPLFNGVITDLFYNRINQGDYFQIQYRSPVVGRLDILLTSEYDVFSLGMPDLITFPLDSPISTLIPAGALYRKLYIDFSKANAENDNLVEGFYIYYEFAPSAMHNAIRPVVSDPYTPPSLDSDDASYDEYKFEGIIGHDNDVDPLFAITYDPSVGFVITDQDPEGVFSVEAAESTMLVNEAPIMFMADTDLEIDVQFASVGIDISLAAF